MVGFAGTSTPFEMYLVIYKFQVLPEIGMVRILKKKDCGLEVCPKRRSQNTAYLP